MNLAPIAIPASMPAPGLPALAPAPALRPAPAPAPELLLNASQAMPRLLAAVRDATSVINISLYGWLDSGSGAQLARAIEQKAHAGVEVNVMLDARGSLVGPLLPGSKFVERLKSSGVNVIVNRSILPFGTPVDHGKSYSIDGRVGFLGGMNLSRTYDTWNDAMVTLDPGAARTVGRDFLERWTQRGGSVSEVNRRLYVDSASAPAAPGAAHVLVNRPGQSTAITDAYLGAIATAQQRIWIESPFLGSQTLVDALVGAARRGVDVRLLTNGLDTDGSVPGANLLATGFYGQLVRGGVKLYQQRQMTHSKILLTDNHAIAGSFNLTRKSEREHHEISLRSSATPFLRQVTAMFDAHMAVGMLVTKADIAQPGTRLLELLRRAARIEY